MCVKGLLSLGLDVPHSSLDINWELVLMELLMNGKELRTFMMVALIMSNHHRTVPDWCPWRGLYWCTEPVWLWGQSMR